MHAETFCRKRETASIRILFAATLGALSLTAADSLAFDGDRNGIVLGMNLGWGVTNIEAEDGYGTKPSYDEPVYGFAWGLRLGYCFKDRLVIHVRGVGLFTGGLRTSGESIDTSGSDVAGVGLDYYFPGERPLFVTATVGQGRTLGVRLGDNFGTVSTGSGASFGAGWEFSPHWAFQASTAWVSQPGLDTWMGLFTVDILLY
jgi:hypothetical protein